jgi:hypothetical protein
MDRVLPGISDMISSDDISAAVHKIDGIKCWIEGISLNQPVITAKIDGDVGGREFVIPYLDMMTIPPLISFLMANHDHKISELYVLNPNVLRFKDESFARDHRTLVSVSVNREKSARFSPFPGVPDVARVVDSSP